MQTKFKKILSGVMSLAMLATFAVPTMVFAAEPVNSVGSVGADIFNETVVGTDVDQGKTSVYDDFTSAGDQSVDVYVTKASTYSVRIPTTVILSGTANGEGKFVGLYQVSVTGDISGEETINVVPDETVTLRHPGKADLTATIDQDKTVWAYADLATNANGEISVEGLTAGSWNGSFKFNIAREALTSAPADLPEIYNILDGNGETVNTFALTNNSTFTIRSDAPMDKFSQVVVDGEVVDPENYTVSEGSTIIQFDNGFLGAMGPGDHEFAIESTDGKASGTFTAVVVPEDGEYYLASLLDYCDCGTSNMKFFTELDPYGALGGQCQTCGHFFDELTAINPDNAEEYFPIEATDGDTYLFGDYRYTYESASNGWRVYVVDDSKSSYGEILSSINGANVVSMYETFNWCQNLTVAPEIPNTVTNLSGAFISTRITVAPVIPSSVTDMSHTFGNCWALTTAPVIPSSVTNMEYTFADCTGLTGTIEINANPTTYVGCFAKMDPDLGAMKPITLTGTSSVLAAIAATATDGNVSVG